MNSDINNKAVYTTNFYVFPRDCNHSGNIIFGGYYMSELDLAAAHAAKQLLRESDVGLSAVTHRADFNFIGPTYAGDEVRLTATAWFGENKSIYIKVLGDVIDGRPVTEHYPIPTAVADFVFITIADQAPVDKPKKLRYINHGRSGMTKEAVAALAKNT